MTIFLLPCRPEPVLNDLVLPILLAGFEASLIGRFSGVPRGPAESSWMKRSQSEPRMATVANRKASREVKLKEAGSKTLDRRNTNWQRGRVRAASWRETAKPKDH